MSKNNAQYGETIGRLHGEAEREEAGSATIPVGEPFSPEAAAKQPFPERAAEDAIDAALKGVPKRQARRILRNVVAPDGGLRLEPSFQAGSPGSSLPYVSTEPFIDLTATLGHLPPEGKRIGEALAGVLADTPRAKLANWATGDVGESLARVLGRIPITDQPGAARAAGSQDAKVLADAAIRAQINETPEMVEVAKAALQAGQRIVDEGKVFPADGGNSKLADAVQSDLDRIIEISMRADLDDKEKRGLLYLVFADLRRRGFELKIEKERLMIREIQIGRLHHETESMLKWIESPAVLEKPQGSRLHDLIDAVRNSRTYYVKDEHAAPCREFVERFDAGTQVFVIMHDWAAAFTKAKDFDGGEWKLPHDRCAFEAVISGKRVIALLDQDDDEDVHVIFFVDHERRWWSVGAPMHSSPAGFNKQIAVAFGNLMCSQIRAISIALEAKVAVTETERAPHRLNRAREKAGKLPIWDYHVVNLNHRTRTVLPDGHAGEPGTRKRLHFRRGHWRHFATWKTWIKWMLVGDPELGWVDKEYRL